MKLKSILPGVPSTRDFNPLRCPKNPSTHRWISITWTPKSTFKRSALGNRSKSRRLGNKKGSGTPNRKRRLFFFNNGSQPENHLHEDPCMKITPPPTIPKHHRHWTQQQQQQQQAPTAQGSSNGGYQQLQAHTLMTNIIILVSIAMIHCSSRYLSNNFLERNKACQFFVTFLGSSSNPFKGQVTSN